MLPPNVSSSRRRIRFATLAALGTFVALVCACDKSEHTATGPLPEVVVTSVEQRDVELRSEWVGTTTGSVNALIRPKVQGYLLKQHYHDGSFVAAGDLLFEIDARQYQAALDAAQGQVAVTQAVLERNRMDVEMYTPLAAQGAVSQKELDDATQALAASRAQLESDKASLDQARLNLAWTKVVSPIAGIAGIAKAQVGDLVGPVTLLTEISQLDPIKVSFQPSEIEYLHFAKQVSTVEASGKPGKAALQLVLADGTVYPHSGHASVAGLGVSTTTGTIELQGLFPNAENLLRPGQFVRVSAVTERLPAALVIPQRAVRDLQGVYQVAVVGEGDKVEFRNVTLGPATGSDSIVQAGLAAGDRVVVEGLQKIRDGMAVKPVAPAANGKSPADAKSSAEPAAK